MRSQEFTAKTVEEALQIGLDEFQVSKDAVEYEVLEEATKGFFGFGSKNALIRVTEKYNPVKAGETFLKNIFDQMNLKTNIKVEKTNHHIIYDIEGDNLGILIGRRGDTLDALQFLLNLAINRRGQEKNKAIIDIENYRANREKTLINLGNKLADKAKKTGQKVVLEPMNPQERRIIHMALQDDKRVNTYSEGEEPYRKVIIVPKRNG